MRTYTLNPHNTGGHDGLGHSDATDTLLDALDTCPCDATNAEQARHLIDAGVNVVLAHRIVETGVDEVLDALTARGDT